MSPLQWRAASRVLILMATVVCLIAYGVLAFSPVQWRPLARLPNEARWTGDVLDFSAPGIARGRHAPIWLPEAMASNLLTIRIVARSHRTEQFGPARILTVSRDVDSRNVTIGQEGDALIIRLRRAGSSFNGVPQFTVGGVFSEPGWRQIEVMISPQRLSVLVDGQSKLEQPLSGAPMADWDPSYGVTLGNEATGERPWLGEIRSATVQSGSRVVQYVSPSEVELPDRYWRGLRIQYLPAIDDPIKGPSHLRDAVLNFLCFVPLGFLITLLLGHRPWWIAFLLCAGLSLAVECLQICFENHFVSLSDWLLNSGGAILGILLARGLWKQTAGE